MDQEDKKLVAAFVGFVLSNPELAQRARTPEEFAELAADLAQCCVYELKKRKLLPSQ